MRCFKIVFMYVQVFQPPIMGHQPSGQDEQHKLNLLLICTFELLIKISQYLVVGTIKYLGIHF